ncbi:hypothetical protein, conserved [Eimeria praecox]|uniref:Uncharacterized protein n=1 Tax=Eimeria praecox TaxID=51316 RepID=U6G8K8_9EIME|nr:hypothetical protein, conserved [Eimeria praecox]
MEADLGQAVLQRSNSHHALDAAEEVERIAFDLYQEAVAFESQLQQAKSAGQPIFPSLPPSPASYGVNFHHGDLERAAHRVDEQPPSLIHQRLTSGPTTAELQPTGRLPELFASSAQPLGGASQAILSRPPILLAAPSRFSWPHQGSFASLESSVAPHLSAVGTDPTAAAGYSVGLLPPNAGLLPQDAGRRRSGLKRRVERSKGKHPELDPDSWLDAPVGTDMSPEGQGQSQSSSPRKRSSNLPAPVSLAASHVPAGDAKQRAASQSSSKASASGAGEAPAAASRPETAAAVQADWVCKHPYVHLPVLAEGVVPPLIQLSASNFEQSKGSSVRDILLPFRFLLKKQALSQIDSNFLVGYVQELASASAARARATKRMRRALHGVVTIGLQFLVLDAIVSALHVLGVSPPSCSWWKAFTECFDTDYRYPEPRVRQQDSARVNIDLANRMLTAMSTYKEGIRPNIEEVIDIKRILFFSPHAPLRFRSPNWDPWRTDHLLFEEANPQFFDWLFKVRKSRH